MIAGDVAAMALLVIAGIGLGYAGLWAFAGPLVAAVLVAAPFRGRLTYQVTAFQFIVLGVPVAILARVTEGTNQLGAAVFYYVGLYLVLIGIIRLVSRPSPSRLPHIIFCASGALAAVGGDLAAPLYLKLVVAFGIPAIVALRVSLPAGPGRFTGKDTRRRLVLGVAFLVMAALATVMTRTLDYYYEDLSVAFIKRMRTRTLTAAGGFSGKARLEDVSRMQSEEAGRAVALRAYSKTAPGYLRGKSFGTYAKGEWTAAGPGAERRTVALETETVRRHVLDGRPSPAAAASAGLTIKTASAYGAHFFLPLAGSAIDTESDLLIVYPGGAIESRYNSTSVGYDVHTDRKPVVPGKSDDVALPDDPEILSTLDAVIARLPRASPSPEEAVALVRNHFAQHYDYELGIHFEPKPDPIVQFLTTKDKGHCELFATGGTLLLRRMGVRARYVTGFQCLEKNPLSDDLWLARNKHAHAWVEFVGRDGAWETAELTPASGLPTVEAASGAESFFDWAHGLYERVMTSVSRYGLVALTLDFLRSGVTWLVSAWWRVALLVLLAAVFVARRFRRRAARVVVQERVFPEDMARERQSFLRLESSLARKGLGKRDPETLPEYAARLALVTFPDREAALALVNRFASRRYAPFGGGKP